MHRFFGFLIMAVSIITFIILGMFSPLFFWTHGILNMMGAMFFLTILLSINFLIFIFGFEKFRGLLIDKGVFYYRLGKNFLIFNAWMFLFIIIDNEPWHFLIPAIILTALNNHLIKLLNKVKEWYK